MSNRYLEIAVSNKSTDGNMSFHQGIANLIFQIPALNSTLIPSSVRISGKIRYYLNDDKDPATSPMSASEKLGVYGVFQSLTTRSIKHQQTIENIRHYAHFLSSFLPSSTSVENNLENIGQSALTLPNSTLYDLDVIRRDATNEFCLPLPCGLFNGTTDIPLNENMLGGLELILALAPDSQYFYSSTGDADTIQTAWYELSDLKLCCEVRDYAPDELSKLMNRTGSSFTYQTISSYFDTINSQQANIWFNLGLSKVRSVFSTFIPSSYINNRQRDGYQTLMPMNLDGTQASVRKVIWTKGGTIYPKHFEMNNNVTINPNNATPSCDPVVVSDYISAISPFNTNENNCLSVANCNRMVQGSGAVADDNLPQSTMLIDGGMLWGLGISYDQLGGSGSDFSSPGASWGLNLELDLTTNNPHSVFIFVNSEINVAFNKNGIQIIQ